MRAKFSTSKNVLSTPAYETKNDIALSKRSKLVPLMNQMLADAVDLQTQAKQAHWNVKGPHFIALHKLFDDIYVDVGGYVDLIAERLVQLGGIALGTVRVSANNSRLEEYPLNLSDGCDHVEALSSALAKFGHLARKAIDDTDKLGDRDSADIFTQVSSGIDKWLWFVEAHAQAEK